MDDELKGTVRMNDTENHDAPAKLREVRYEYTPNLPDILQHLKASLLVSTYQAGKLLILGAHQGKLQITFSDFEQAMGLAVSEWCIAVGAKRQVHFFTPAHEVVRESASGSAHDGCFVPRSSFYTGSILGHDLAWGDDGLWVVNTLFSTLCTLHENYHFVPRWRPPFVSQLIDQDRCHLNGLAMDNGQPRYVTVLAESDVPAGWRPTKATSGCVLDVPSGQTIARGFAMPHSPRVYQGRLWVLDSGTGRLCMVDPATGIFEGVERMPGYTRGLAFHGQFAFVGLSRIRESAVFGGLPIAQQPEPLRCGIGVVDLRSGKTVAVFQFHSGVEEIFAVEILPRVQHPLFAGALVDSAERDVRVVPPENAPRPTHAPRLPLFAHGRPTAADPQTGAAARGEQLLTEARGLQQTGQLDAAVSCFQQAIELSRKPAPWWVELGNLHQDRSDQQSALTCYREAIQADSQCVPALQNLGYLLFNRGQPDEAAEVYRQLLALAPTPMNRLLAAAVLPVIYDSNEQLHEWRQSVEDRLRDMVRRQATVDARDQLIPTNFFLAYQGLNDRPIMQLRGQVIRGDDRLPTTPKPRSSERIRVGFLSAYFRDHTIGRLNIGRIERMDRSRFEVVVATTVRQADPLSVRYERAADVFLPLTRDVRASRDALRRLELDILIFADVGMDALTSTLVFSRLAPIQCVTWGHPETTGSPCADYFLSSQLLETADADAHYTESLVRMPLLGTFYERPVPSGPMRDRASFALPEDRHVYLCPQTLFKFHPDFDAILAGILAADPQAEIVLLEGRVPAWTERLRKRWASAIPQAAHRLRFLPAVPRDDFLSLLKLADVIIDPLHFGGGNTTYEAMGVGTPVVTLPGEFLRSRITYAMYQKMGWTELVVQSPEAYVATAVACVVDPELRTRVRQAIAERADCLFEDPREVRVLEDALATLANRQA